METNEIELNTITAENTENAQIVEKQQPSVKVAEPKKEETVSQDTIDINSQKTRKIEILSELINDTEITQQKNTEAKLRGIAEAKEHSSNKNPESDSDVKVVEKDEQDDKDYKLEQMLLNRINIMQGKIQESLRLIEKFERINAKEENVPNIVTTLRDKLTQEVIRQFRTVGIKFNMKSYLVQAVVSDLLGKFEEGITDFKECSENLNFVREVQENFESKVELAPTSKVKNLFARLRGIIKPEKKQEKLYELERERQEKKLEQANILLIKYKYKNSELANYTIRKNIVESLTKEMIHGKGAGSNDSVEAFIQTRIAPEMEKLGLQYLNDSLNESLFKEYNASNEDSKVDSQEAFMQMSMNELSGKGKDEFTVAREKITVTTKEVKPEVARENITVTTSADDDREVV